MKRKYVKYQSKFGKYVYGPMSFNDTDPQVHLERTRDYKGGTVKLTGAEHDILLVLADHADGVFITRQRILEKLYGKNREDMPEEKTIDVLICKTRSKLKAVNGLAGFFIETAHGEGYRFGVPAAVVT